MLLGDELRAAIRAAYEVARELGAAEDPPETIPAWDELPLAMILAFIHVYGAGRQSAKMLGFMESQGAKSVIMADGLMGCPHQEGIDYECQYCPDPACAFWHGRDRFTHKMVQ